MKMYPLFTLFLGLSLVLSSCCEKCKTALEICEKELTACETENCIDISPPSTVGSPFYLSLSLKKRGKYQTIFIESPTDNTGNTFAIAACFSYDSFENGIYKNVKIKELILRRLAGDSFKISDAKLGGKSKSFYDNNKKVVSLDITVEKTADINYRDEHRCDKVDIEIKTLKVGEDMLHSNIIYFNSNLKERERFGWGSRICESHIR